MKFLYALILITLLTACATDEVQTAGQINAGKISEELSRYNVNNLQIYEQYSDIYFLKYEGANFRIDGQFLIVNNFEYWNLDRMVSFTSGSRTMTLYFK
ncbi:MAG: hypothetical protein O9262_07540 [Cyclobacteriaceae bacterium]|nr:hypothetical protein [Cyclobacteriaceae bacterium]